MADPAQIQQMLQNLQSQIGTIASIAAQAVPPPSLTPQPLLPTAVPDLQGLVKSMVAAELSKRPTPPAATLATPATPALAAPAVAAPSPGMGKMEALLPIIGAAFTQEQQEWLSQPANLLGLPGFFMTGDGRKALVSTLEAYQAFVRGSS